MNKYIQEIIEIETLSNEETIHLFKLFKAGDMLARKKLIEHNMKLVLKIAFKYQTKITLTMEELISIGVEGLIKAIDNFKINEKYKLSTLAYICIENAFKNYIAAANRKKRNNSNDISLQSRLSIDKYGNEITLEDTIKDDRIHIEDIATNCSTKETIDLILSKLTEQEQDIISLKYGLANGVVHTYKSIAEKYDCSQQNIKAKTSRVLRKLMYLNK